MKDKYINLTQMLVKRYGRPYLHHNSFDELLSYAYEALIEAYRGFNGTGNIEGWIRFKVRKSLIDCARDNAKPEFISLEDANLSVNGYQIKRFIDRQYIKYLMNKAKLPDIYRDRIRKYYFEGYKMKEIGNMEGVSESAISLSLIKAKQKMKRIAQNVIYHY